MPVSDNELDAYQHDAAGKGKSFNLKRVDPAAKPCSSGDKAADKAAVSALALELDELQNLLYANRKHRLLVVLQGLDTSGKDGTVRGVFSATSPLGVHAVGWKAPTEDELAHDYLWRIHRCVPPAGEIVVFNRSHYEDVLVPVVEGWIDKAETKRRYAQIEDFERLLVETATTIVKCMLHIDKEEQRQRLQARIDTPGKEWKFSMADLEVRTKWDAYQRAYDKALAATSSAHAPWHVIPANSKRHRNLMIAELLVKTLHEMDLKPPPADPALRGLVVN